MFKKKDKIVEKHKITILGPVEEIYPVTKRKIYRPDIKFKKVLLFFFLHILFIVLLVYACNWGITKYVPADKLFFSSGIRIFLLSFIFTVLCIIIRAKRILVFIIRLYQKYASYEIRCRCVFIPNCSEYMILAIEKYGLIEGIKKGIDRFHRCNPSNGGEDYP